MKTVACSYWLVVILGSLALLPAAGCHPSSSALPATTNASARKRDGNERNPVALSPAQADQQPADGFTGR